MRSIRQRFALVFTLIAAGFVSRSIADEPAARVASGSIHDGIDPSVRPQDDFFRHVNGGWIARTEIPPDRPMFGSFFQLRDKSEAALRAIIDECAANRVRRRRLRGTQDRRFLQEFHG